MPVTDREHDKSMEEPPLCEQLPVRDYLDNLMVRTNGNFVAAYELGGVHSYFASDEERERTKVMVGAMLKSLPEQTMRLQVRCESLEDPGELLEAYAHLGNSDHAAVRLLDEERLEAWRSKTADALYLRLRLHVYLIWDWRLHRRLAG